MTRLRHHAVFGFGPTAWLLAMLLCALHLASPRDGEAGVRVAIVPAQGAVEPGAEFDLTLRVTEAGSAFNGFDAIIEFDPDALIPIALSPLTLQEGALMTAACANRFHRFRPGASQDTVALVLLCQGATVSGPGVLYRLRFRAAMTPQSTVVRFFAPPRFFEAGIAVLPVEALDATITIGGVVGVDGPSSRASRVQLRAVPNPSRTSFALWVDGPETSRYEASIHDVRGRRIRRLGSVVLGPSPLRVSWDGRDDFGQMREPGVYFARLRGPDGETSSIPLVRVE